jgi:hypothetical protein
MLLWLHKLFNPHCEHCQEKEEMLAHCETCEVLKMELASVKQERARLLDKLLNKDIEVPVKEEEEAEFKPLNRVHLPWKAKQQLLEKEDRANAALLRAKEKEMKNNQDPVIKTLEEAILGDDEDALPGSNAQIQVR